MADDSVKPRAEIGVFPLFPEKAASPSMMKHAMELTMKGTSFLNPGQTAVLGADQPLYAIAKQLQWRYPNLLGEDKMVLMMGTLHIEDKAQQMVGKILRDSGWTSILSQAQVLTTGRALSALNENHINNQFAKDKCSIPMDMTVVLGYHKFSLQATIDHHGPSIYSGHYTTSVNCCNRTFYCNDNKITEFDMINTKNSSTAYVVIYKLIT